MAFKCSVATNGYYHDLSAFNSGSATRSMFALWIRPVTDSSYRRIVHTNFSTSASLDSLQILKLNNNKICIGQNSGNTAGSSEVSNLAVTSGEWIHVIGWGGFGQDPKLWINGVRQTGSNTVALGTGSQNARLYIGMRSSAEASFIGDIGEVCHWVTNTTANLPAPSDQEAMTLYRSGNPWTYKPGALSLYRPFQTVDQPAIYLGSSTGSSVKVGTPTQADEHPPITSDNFSFVSIVGGGATTEAATTFGFSVGSTALGGAEALSGVASGVNCGVSSGATAGAGASGSFDLSVNYAASAVVSIETLASFSAGAGSSSIAAAVALADAANSVSVGLSPAVVVVAEAAIITGSSVGAVSAGQAVTAGSVDANVVVAVALNNSVSAQAIAESQVVIDASLAASVIAQAASEASISIGQVLGMSCVGSTLSGDIVTPDGRKCTVSANLRACSIPSGSRNITVN